MITLSATAVIHDFVAPVGVADSDKLLSDLFNRLIPADFGIRSIFHSLHRRSEPVTTILIMVDPQTLLAGVPLACRMVLVAANANDFPTVNTNLDTAVVGTQNASRFVPFLRRVNLGVDRVHCLLIPNLLHLVPSLRQHHARSIECDKSILS